METILAFFNHFPLFAIMLRLKDPHRLPGGLEFEIFNHDYFLLEHHGILHRFKKLYCKFKPVKQEKTIHISSRKSTKKSIKKQSITLTIPNTNSKHNETANVSSKGAYLWMRVNRHCI